MTIFAFLKCPARRARMFHFVGVVVDISIMMPEDFESLLMSHLLGNIEYWKIKAELCCITHKKYITIKRFLFNFCVS